MTATVAKPTRVSRDRDRADEAYRQSGMPSHRSTILELLSCLLHRILPRTSHNAFRSAIYKYTLSLNFASRVKTDRSSFRSIIISKLIHYIERDRSMCKNNRSNEKRKKKARNNPSSREKLARKRKIPRDSVKQPTRFERLLLKFVRIVNVFIHHHPFHTRMHPYTSLCRTLSTSESRNYHRDIADINSITGTKTDTND